MIRNGRQYRITKSRAGEFQKALEQLERERITDSKAPDYLRWKIQFDATKTQLDELLEDLQEYEALRGNNHPAIEIASVDDLPRALIQGRIAAGLTQKMLAEKLGLKEQQVQRYEATDYQGASLDRIKEIIKVLGIRFKQDVVLPDQSVKFNSLLKKFGDVGLDADFCMTRMIPEKLRTALEKHEAEGETERLVFQWANTAARIFGVGVQELVRPGPLKINELVLTTGRFKLPANFAKTKLAAYTVYAHYLALLTLQATPESAISVIPASWKHVRRQILARYSEINLKNVVSYCWDMGVPILPLSDPAVFHGATWRVRGRNVIVVKQRTKSEARWMTDIIHELWHAAQNPDVPDNSLVELDPRSTAYVQSEDEEIATDFAADVLLNGRSEELAQECARVCSQRTEWLKNAVQKVSTARGVREDILANYMAYRLSMEAQNWWPTAASMQRTTEDAWKVVRDAAIVRIDWSRLSPPDRELLEKSLTEKE